MKHLKKRGRPKKENNDKNVKDKKTRGRPRKKDVVDFGSDSERVFPKKEPTRKKENAEDLQREM